MPMAGKFTRDDFDPLDVHAEQVGDVARRRKAEHSARQNHQ